MSEPKKYIVVRPKFGKPTIAYLCNEKNCSDYHPYTEVADEWVARDVADALNEKWERLNPRETPWVNVTN